MSSSTPTTNSSEALSESFSKMDTADPTLIGTHCQYTYCNQLDFLPFPCESCRHTFCLDHRTESSHKCTHAGAWAARKRAQELSKPSIGAGAKSSMLDVESPKPCASPTCKTVVNRGAIPGVHCPTCNRTYCLTHRMKEDHNCKNLIPLGARPKIFDANSSAEKARNAFGKLKAWGSAQKEKAATASRVLPKPKPSSAAARLVAVNTLKKTAKGDEKLPAEKRIYLYVEAEAATTTAKYPKGAFWFSKDWVVGRLLDDAAKRLMVENVNNQSLEEVDKLRVFSVEGGRLLEFGEKLGTAVVSGNTLVLLRGVGPAVPDLITL